jgi:hypothetical protein
LRALTFSAGRPDLRFADRRLRLFDRGLYDGQRLAPGDAISIVMQQADDLARIRRADIQQVGWSRARPTTANTRSTVENLTTRTSTVGGRVTRQTIPTVRAADANRARPIQRLRIRRATGGGDGCDGVTGDWASTAERSVFGGVSDLLPTRSTVALSCCACLPGGVASPLQA